MSNTTPVAYIFNEAPVVCTDFDIVGNSKRNDFVIGQGTLQVAEVINRNKRMYIAEDLRNQIYGDNIRELVSTGNMKGEAGHPIDMNLTRQQKIDPTLEQVLYTKLWMEGPVVKAHFRGTNNDLGRSFNEDLKDGQRPSFSLRSIGSIRMLNGKTNVTNLKIITYDRVYFPSYPQAYTDGIVSATESCNLYQEYSVPEIVTERGNSMVMGESANIIAPIMNNDIVQLLLKESCDVYSVCNDFAPYYQSIKVSEDKQKVTMVTESYDTIVIPLGRYIQNRIDEFCNRLY